jgi:microcystin-dependent protein
MPLYQGGGSLNAAITGEVRMWAGTIASIPSGWLFCNGASLLRASYPSLFAAIGVIYGNADGTHFNAPNFIDRFLVGALADYAGIPKTTIEGSEYATGGGLDTAQGNAVVTDSGHSHELIIGGSFVDIGGTGNYGIETTSGYASLTDSGHTHRFMSPYYAITYIIKT